jgi:hypothetical protein
MKALELAHQIECLVRRDPVKRDEICVAAAAELRRLAEVNAELVDALEKLENAFIVHTNWSGEPIAEIQHARSARAKAKEQK